MRLPVTEQSTIQVRTGIPEEGCLGHHQADALIDLGDRMGARIATWQGRAALHFQQFVGAVRVGDLELEILPKLEGLNDPAHIRHNLLAMLALTEDLEVRASELVGFLESSEPFISALARLYCSRLLEAVRRGLRQEYVVHEDVMFRVRGKISWPAQARLQAAQRLEFSCVFDERSEDTPLNRTLKAALLRAAMTLSTPRSAKIVAELRHAMDGISGTCPPMEQLTRLRTDRMSRNVQPLLTLAKLILGNRNPDLGRSTQGDSNTYAVVWDMNVLFEEYVGRVAQNTLELEGFRVDLQHGSTYLAREVRANQEAFLLKPDILVVQGRKWLAVADTKWKPLSHQKPNLGVAESDVYQVLAYAQRYETDLAVLIYPHHPALGVPGRQRDFLIYSSASQQVRVRIVTLDLARLDSLPDTLRRELLVDGCSEASASIDSDRGAFQ